MSLVHYRRLHKELVSQNTMCRITSLNDFLENESRDVRVLFPSRKIFFGFRIDDTIFVQICRLPQRSRSAPHANIRVTFFVCFQSSLKQIRCGQVTLGLSSDGSKLPSKSSCEQSSLLNNNHISRSTLTSPEPSSQPRNSSNSSSPLNDNAKKVSNRGRKCGLRARLTAQLYFVIRNYNTRPRSKL